MGDSQSADSRFGNRCFRPPTGPRRQARIGLPAFLSTDAQGCGQQFCVPRPAHGL